MRAVSFASLLPALTFAFAAPVAAQGASEAPSPQAPAAAEAPSAPNSGAPEAAETTLSVEEEVEGESFPFHMSASLSHYVGQGTFVLGYSGNPYVATALTLSPSLELGDFTVGAEQAFDLEWTQSDSTTVNNQIIYSDTQVSVRYGGLKLSDLDLRFPLTGRVDLPLALASRHAGKLAGLGVGAGVSWSYDPWNLTLGANVSGTYNIIVRELAGGAALDPQRPFTNSKGDSVVPSGCIRRDPSEIANFACGVIPRLAALGGAVTAGWSALDGQIAVNGSLGLGTSIAYYLSPADDKTSENAVPGLGHAEVTRAMLSVAYTPVDWFTLSAGTQTVQVVSVQTYMNDQPIYRVFPLWDVYTPSNNYSTFFVDTTFTY